MTKNGKTKILVVLTGGTICSFYDGNVKKQGGEAGTVIEKNFYESDCPVKDEIEFVRTDNFGIFSENMTVDKWNLIADRLRGMPEVRDIAAAHGSYPSVKGEKPSSDGICDGIIIAHGTDSLAYSAAMFSLLLRDLGVPVFLVSANESLDSEKTNGNANFRAAVECIRYGIRPGVRVTYRNISDGKTYLHLASRLTQCANYSEDFFSAGMTDISGLSPENADELFSRLPAPDTKRAFGDGIDFFIDRPLRDTVLKIEPYVGLNYDFFDLSRVEAIYHATYHSGTVCAEKTEKSPEYGSGSVLSLLDRCGDIPVYIGPSDLSGGIYDTVLFVGGHSRNARFVNGCTKEMMYCKLLVAVSFPELRGKTDGFMNGDYCGEMCA